MNMYHLQLVEEFKKNAGQRSKLPEGYSGSFHPGYNLTSPTSWQIAKSWVKAHPELTLTEFIELLDSLYLGKTYEEKSFTGKLLGLYPKLRNQLNPNLLDKWLEDLIGWAEVDSTCQNVFTYQELLAKWPKWEKLLLELSKSSNVSKRRASIVLLTGPVNYSDNPLLADLAFTNIAHLQHEKDIMISKAISWLLRSLIKNHRQQVTEYLQSNQDTLPKIAIRETTRKLQTGRK